MMTKTTTTLSHIERGIEYLYTVETYGDRLTFVDTFAQTIPGCPASGGQHFPTQNFRTLEAASAWLEGQGVDIVHDITSKVHA